MAVTRDNLQKTAVVVIGDSGLSVDLGWVSVGSTFFKAWEEVERELDLSCLVVVDKNPERAIEKSRSVLNQGVGAVTIVWNAERSKPYSYSMIALAREMGHCSFSIFGSTARLEIAVEPAVGLGAPTQPDAMREVLIERFRAPSTLSVGELNTLIEDYEELLHEMETLALKDSELRLELQILRKRSSQLPRLYEKLKTAKTENLRLRKRNDALARKAFNKLSK